MKTERCVWGEDRAKHESVCSPDRSAHTLKRCVCPCLCALKFPRPLRSLSPLATTTPLSRQNNTTTHTHEHTHTRIQTNSEIILRPYQFCNLTEVVVRAGDDLAALQRKARLAAILGGFHCCLCKFWQPTVLPIRVCVQCMHVQVKWWWWWWWCGNMVHQTTSQIASA